jgi:hypothetical protein
VHVGDVPYPDVVSGAAAGQGLAVRAERHRGDRGWSSEDLPAPDTISRPGLSRHRAIRSRTWVAAVSRPKKNAASRSSNAPSPLYGNR